MDQYKIMFRRPDLMQLDEKQQPELGSDSIYTRTSILTHRLSSSLQSYSNEKDVQVAEKSVSNRSSHMTRCLWFHCRLSASSLNHCNQSLNSMFVTVSCLVQCEAMWSGKLPENGLNRERTSQRHSGCKDCDCFRGL